MKKRRKTEECLNCGFSLDPSFDYCPKCGQENSNNQISFGKLLKEFLDNYFSLDSRFGRSIKPFFFKPGILTREFMDGKRVKYANPIRLYLVISLVHFFVFSIYSAHEGSNSSGQGILQDISEDSTERKNVITFSSTEKLDSLDNETDSTNGFFSKLSDQLTLIKSMAKDHTIKEVMDTLDVADHSYLEQITLRQLVKLEREGGTTLKAYIQKNIPILMFFLLPMYALILKLFFRKRLYINHVVHSLHLHSFLFIVLTLFWILAILIEVPGFVAFTIIIILLTYLVFSFRNTYTISFMTAFMKIALSGFIYLFVLNISFLVTLAISFYTF